MKHALMNRILLASLLCFALLLSGCGTPATPTAPDAGPFTIVASFYPMYIFTLNVALDVPGVVVLNMTEPQTGCLHDYELSTADRKTLEGADAFVINGAGMESFMDLIEDQLKDLPVVEASRGIELIESENEHTVNPHVWVGISGAIQQVKNIAEQLAEIDAVHAVLYQDNATRYVARLEALRDRMHEALKDVENRRIVTFHESFPYFAKEFDLEVVGVVEKEPGQEPTAEELSVLIDIVRAKDVKVLFTEEQYPVKAAETLARETGAKVFAFDFVVTGPKTASPSSYEDAMERNLTLLKTALK